MLTPATVQDDRMFLAEIGVMRKLSHPYIVRYLGCGILSESQPDGAPQKHFIAVVRSRSRWISPLPRSNRLLDRWWDSQTAERPLSF